MVRQKLLVLAALIATLSFINCGKGKDETPIKIDPAKTDHVSPVVNTNPLRVSISAMISPKETFIYYKGITDYIGKKMGRDIELVQRGTYAQVNELIETHQTDIAFVCAGPYVDGKKKFGMELIAAPVAYGESTYYSYIIVHKDSPIKDMEGLKGKSFGFTDPSSNTGCLVPKYELAKLRETPDSFFERHIFTKSHDNSIRAVGESIIDGAAVDHLIWEYLAATNPAITAQTKVIKKLGPFGMPPVVVHPDCDKLMKEKLRAILLNMDKDEEGKGILKKIFIDRFTIVDDSHYDSVRKMQDWIDAQKK